MQQRQPQTIAHIESLLVVAVFENPDLALSEHAITIHQQEFNA
jgi:hypothetical protein